MMSETFRIAYSVNISYIKATSHAAKQARGGVTAYLSGKMFLSPVNRRTRVPRSGPLRFVRSRILFDVLELEGLLDEGVRQRVIWAEAIIRVKREALGEHVPELPHLRAALCRARRGRAKASFGVLQVGTNKNKVYSVG